MESLLSRLAQIIIIFKDLTLASCVWHELASDWSVWTDLCKLKERGVDLLDFILENRKVGNHFICY